MGDRTATIVRSPRLFDTGVHHGNLTRGCDLEGDLAGGSGEVSADSGLFTGAKLTWAARTERPDTAATATSPEELLAAAHAGCYAMALSHTLAEAGHTAARLDVKAVVHFTPDGGGPRSTSPSPAGRPASTGPGSSELAQQGEQGCPMSNLFRAGTEIRPEATLGCEPRRPVFVPLAVCRSISVVLLPRTAGAGIWVQRLLGLATWVVLLALLRGEGRSVRIQVAAVMVAATMLEYTASPLLGLYTYRLQNVPSFVPPGHGLVYLAALTVGRAVSVPAWNGRSSAPRSAGRRLGDVRHHDRVAAGHRRRDPLLLPGRIPAAWAAADGVRRGVLRHRVPGAGGDVDRHLGVGAARLPGGHHAGQPAQRHRRRLRLAGHDRHGSGGLVG